MTLNIDTCRSISLNAGGKKKEYSHTSIKKYHKIFIDIYLIHTQSI